jgi:AraC-like DNA-binding protein
MDGTPTASTSRPLQGFTLARIERLDDLEGGTYWPLLRPYFIQPEYHRLRYSVRERPGGNRPKSDAFSVRGASRAGELDIAFVADRLATTLTVMEAGLSGYCLTLVRHGELAYSGATRTPLMIDDTVGLIYRGAPGTELAASGNHERLAIWIPESSLTQRLAALLGAPVPGEAEFQPVIDWSAPQSQSLRRLFELLLLELQSSGSSILECEAASRSFTDIFIYTLLRSLPHTYSGQIEQPGVSVAPGMLRRAEAYVHAHVEEPIALHEVAAAAGCSVRSLQLAFRNFRETTPLLAIRHARLEAARDALRLGDAGSTITEIAHRFGFANSGRFTRLYRTAFGESPLEVLRRRRG